MYNLAWQTLEQDFARRDLVGIAQRMKIHVYPLLKLHTSLETPENSLTVSGCVNVRSQYGYKSDIAS